MQAMTSAEYRSFLLDRSRTGKLATVCADGRPHIAPIWFDLDGDQIVFMTSEQSVKGRNIRRDPQASLCVDDETPPFSFVIIEGVAEVSDPTPEELLAWSTRIARRYMGDELAEAYGKRNAVPEELLIRITPTRIIARAGIAD